MIFLMGLQTILEDVDCVRGILMVKIGFLNSLFLEWFFKWWYIGYLRLKCVLVTWIAWIFGYGEWDCENTAED